MYKACGEMGHEGVLAVGFVIGTNRVTRPVCSSCATRYRELGRRVFEVAYSRSEPRPDHRRPAVDPGSEDGKRVGYKSIVSIRMGGINPELMTGYWRSPLPSDQ